MSVPDDLDEGLPDLPDLAGLSLDELARLDDSVVANVIRQLAARRRGYADYLETVSEYGDGL